MSSTKITSKITGIAAVIMAIVANSMVLAKGTSRTGMRNNRTTATIGPFNTVDIRSSRTTATIGPFNTAKRTGRTGMRSSRTPMTDPFNHRGTFTTTENPGVKGTRAIRIRATWTTWLPGWLMCV